LRLDFNVLWVDDQPERVGAQITRIKSQMESEGFRFNPTQLSSLAGVEALIAESVFQDEVDLLLVDWDLGGGVHGQDVIKRVREVAPYKDVVFYSAQTPASELRRLAFDAGLEGIYCARREELVDEVFGVFESLVKKVLDLDHTRGIVMGATSDIDHIVHACLIHIETTFDAAGKKKLLAQLVERVQERVKDITRLGAKLESATTVATVLEAHMIFTANDRLRTLRRLLEADAKHAPAATTVKDYMEKILRGRNELGHMVLAPEGKPQSVATAEGKQVSLEEMRDLRRLILGLREEFRSLAEALKR
jgi:hypothetical protein